MKVLNFGSLNLDYVYSVDHIVAPGETLASASLTENCGGKGLNQSIALAKAGLPVMHAGMVGSDGTRLLEELRAAGVDISLVKEVPVRTGHAIIQVDRNAQNCILLFGGANRAITADYIDEVMGNFGEGDILLLQNEVNEMPRIIDRAYARGMKIILNPSPYDDALKACDLSKVSVFILNEIEGAQVTGKGDTEDVLAALKELYPDAEVVLTLGSDGSVYQGGGKTVKQGCFKVEAVDTTAAGDTFTGYFISAMVKGLSPEEGLELAAKASAVAVTRAGAAVSIPTPDEVERFFT